jgi:hypothetical protein
LGRDQRSVAKTALFLGSSEPILLTFRVFHVGTEFADANSTMTNKPNSNYETILKGELTEFVTRLKRRQALKQELEALNLEISKCRQGVIGLAALANVDVRQSHPEIFRAEFEAAIGLTEAICKVFDDIDPTNGYSAAAIREELETMNFPTHAYSNPDASITKALNRMADAGKFILATDQDTNRTVYLWAEGGGAQCLRRQDDEVEELDRQYIFSGELGEFDSLEESRFRRAK